MSKSLQTQDLKSPEETAARLWYYVLPPLWPCCALDSLDLLSGVVPPSSLVTLQSSRFCGQAADGIWDDRDQSQHDRDIIVFEITA